MSDTAEHSHHQIVGHEHKEANVRIIVETVIGLIVSVAIVCFIVWGIFNLFKSQVGGSERRASQMAVPAQLPPYPRLEVHPWEELRVLRAHEDDVLDHYRWIDKQSGVVHIPIEKAIDEVVNQLPVRPGTQGGQNARGK
jgi:hypothetical protein